MKVDDLLPRLEARFGAPLGPVLVGLLKLARKQRLEDAGVRLVNLGADDEPLPRRGSPKDVMVFLETGMEGREAGFVMSGEYPTMDSRPVCTLEYGDCHVVAPTLAGYLSLVALAGAEHVLRDADDAEWMSTGHDRLEDDQFRELSDLLCTLPGVAVPERPSSITRAHPDMAFEYFAESIPGPGTPLERVQRLWELGFPITARKELVKQIDVLLGIGEMVQSPRWRELQSILATVKPPLPDSVRTRLRAFGVDAP